MSKHNVRDFLLAMMPTNSVGAEIGVHEGDFTDQVLQIVRPRKLHLIDPWKYEPSPVYKTALYGSNQGQSQSCMDKRYSLIQKRFANQIQSGQVSVCREPSDSAVMQFNDGYFDWVYIDGNHLYDFVFGDLSKYLIKVRPGGLIAGDDYGTRGWWSGGVTRAVNDFMEQFPVKGKILGRKRQFLLERC